MKAVIYIPEKRAALLLSHQIQRLGNRNSTVAFLGSGQVLQYLEERSADAVFFDIDEEIDWQNFCARVKYADKRIELVLLSGNPINAVKAFELGAYDFLLKPISQERVEKVIERLV